MNFNNYQKLSQRTALYKDKGHNFIYPTLGLAGETGEVAEKVKKILRDKNGLVDEATKNSLKKELGDVLWYLTQLATEFGLSLDDIADTNLKKLLSRLESGKISGDGDER
ncbi:MAG: nucleoside triphosphate pyrophosphohydrolase family protein [Candidatus Magasanikbacteria bacterium]|nr:nucleoside triphosphate pyrophosphohydrolase family protein [Candidatus Magasanikbacteria bacterium]